MHVDFTWQIVRGPAEVFTALESHTADVAIGAIAITSESEQRVDFSLPHFDSGLRIMVRARYEAGVVNTVKSIPWTAIGHLLTVGILVIFLLANVLWLIERHRKREPRRSYLSAIGEALWGAMLVVATLNVDRDSPAMKRVTILLVWLFGVVLIAQLTATVTSTQTVARLQSTIRGPEDLPGKIIASVPGTVAGDLSDCARPAVHDRHLWTGRDSHAHARRGPGGGIRRRDAAVLGGQGGQGRRAGRRMGPTRKSTRRGSPSCSEAAARSPWRSQGFDPRYQNDLARAGPGIASCHRRPDVHTVIAHRIHQIPGQTDSLTDAQTLELTGRCRIGGEVFGNEIRAIGPSAG
jgi:ABC-type amino acid transport substrate-binding protein